MELQKETELSKEAVADTVRCPYCKELIKREAVICKHCHTDLSLPGSMQSNAYSNLNHYTESSGTLWLPIPSLIIGIISLLACFDSSPWDADTITGLILFGIIGTTLGVVGVSVQRVGRGMSIAGIVMGSLAVLVGLGLAVEMF